MTIKFKEVLNNKFWIVEDQGTNVGTVSFNDDQYMLTLDSQFVIPYYNHNNLILLYDLQVSDQNLRGQGK